MMTPEEQEQAEEAELRTRTTAAPNLELSQCIFSEKRFDDFEGALNHMAREYGFFIPDVEYLADPEGLVTYLRVRHVAACQLKQLKSRCKLPYNCTDPCLCT